MLWGANCCSGTGCALVSGSWAIVLCTTFLSWVLSSLYFYLPFHYYKLVLYFTFFQLWNCPYLNPWVLGFSWFSIPSHMGGEAVRSICVVLSCWLLLNHDRSQHACCALAHSLKMPVLRSCYWAAGLPLFAWAACIHWSCISLHLTVCW